MASGKQFVSRAELLQAFGCTILKEVSVPGESFNFILVKYTDSAAVVHYRVLLEAAQEISLEAGHFVGSGWTRDIHCLNDADPELPKCRSAINAWTFNRGTEYKRDIMHRANGM